MTFNFAWWEANKKRHRVLEGGKIRLKEGVLDDLGIACSVPRCKELVEVDEDQKEWQGEEGGGYHIETLQPFCRFHIVWNRRKLMEEKARAEAARKKEEHRQGVIEDDNNPNFKI